MVGGDRVGDVLQDHGLAGARLRHDQPTLAFAERGHDVDDAPREVLAVRPLGFHLHPLVGIERRQIVEMDLVALLFGIVEIDGVDFQQGEIALALLRAPDLPFDRIAGAQAKPSYLAGADIDVVGTSQIVGVGRAQEAEAVQQHLDHANAGDIDVTGRQLLEDREHELLLAQGARILDLDFFGEA